MKRFWIIYPTALVALTLLASFFWKSALWGLSAWGALSPLVAVAFAIIVVPQLFLKPSGAALDRFPSIGSRVLRALAIAAVSAAILWLLRSRHELWGERFALRAAVEAGARSPAAPFSTSLQTLLYRFMNGVFLTSADTVITLFSIAAGALYAVLAARAAGLLLDANGSGGANRLAAAVLLSGGYTALFFGFGGNVQIALVAALAFLLAGVRFLREKGSLVPAAVLLYLAVRSHASAVYLAPSLVYLFACGVRAASTRRRTIVEASLFVVFVAAMEGLHAFIGRNPGAAHTALPSLRTIVVPPSLSNAVNTLLIVGPSSVAAVFLLARNARPRAPETSSGPPSNELAFLGVSAAAALAEIIAGSSLSEGGLGWQALATTGPAFSMYALWALKGESPDAARFRRVAAALALVGLFQTLPLVLVDAIPRAAEKRLLDLAIAPGRAEMIVADAAFGRGDLDKARAWYLASLGKNKSNELASFRLGTIAMKREEYPEAISHFLDAHELKPREPGYRFALAEALIEKRWFPEAIAQLETLTVAYPESVSFWRRLGFARNNGNRYESAIAAYERALSLEPRNEENRRNLTSALLNRGAELQDEKKYGDARAIYERAIKTYPRDWRAHNNISIIEMNQGHLEKARDILDEALKLFPYETSLHFNMGIVLEKLGRNKEALEHMRLARDLDPVYSAAPMHIERLAKKLGIWDEVQREAQRDSQRSPLNSP
jgi:tetratricopeptide (TPR) repeat protein